MWNFGGHCFCLENPTFLALKPRFLAKIYIFIPKSTEGGGGGGPPV